jgi:catechol 2,3-dioxygenase-like lactoylglutathione lyase family enzyme
MQGNPGIDLGEPGFQDDISGQERQAPGLGGNPPEAPELVPSDDPGRTALAPQEHRGRVPTRPGVRRHSVATGLHGYPQIRDCLLGRGAGQLAHPGGTLYEHLVRVAELLADWGADEALQAAGLCHACYGTDGYPQTLLALAERPVLAALIGTRAESLVYLYGSCDRGAVYRALGRAGPVSFRDRFTGRMHTPPEPDVRAFTELTAANELDIIRHNPATAAQHGAALRQLFARARPRLTDVAWQAWNQHPGADPSRPPEQGRQMPPVSIDGLDHLVLTVTDLDQAVGFYEQVLGMRPGTFGAGRRALEFGISKINLHQAGHEITPHAGHPLPGSADLCLITTTPPGQVLAHLDAQHVQVEDGPVPRTGAHGPITSIYIRDPDGNLIEIASYPAHLPAGQPS